jgi:hypothetical protein
VKIILPKRWLDINPENDALFFLVGPIKGGDDWQYQAIEKLRQHNFHRKNLCIAVPCRYNAGHALYDFAVESSGHRTFEHQTPWERIYLELASKSNPGGIVAWLPRESTYKPRTDGQPYARDTYGELGEWRGRMMSDPSIRFTLGVELGFLGLEVIQRNFDSALNRHFPIYSSLEETIDAAVKKV